MAVYEISEVRTLGKEGGFSNVKKDKGGRTWQGVAERYWGEKYPRIFQILDEAKECYSQDLKAMERWLYNHQELSSMVHHFYKVEFWDVQQLDKIEWQTVADKIFDMGVNCGVGEAGYVVQRALNIANRNEVDYPDIKEDGGIGPLTRDCLGNLIAKRGILKTEILLAMEHFQTYRAIVRNDEEQEVFFWGWFNRLLSFIGVSNFRSKT